MYEYDDYEQYYNPEDFLEDYEVQLRDLITDAVNKKIQKTVEELKIEKENRVQLEEKLRELKNNIYNSDRVHKEQLEKALMEKQKAVEEKLSCGFVPHDTVWYVKSDSKRLICPKCNGQYKIKVEVLGKDKEVDCPHCSYGSIYQYTYYPARDIVSSIYFNFHRKNSGIELYVDKIYLDKSDFSWKPDELYKSEEECQLKCDRLNNKNKTEESK